MPDEGELGSWENQSRENQLAYLTKVRDRKMPVDKLVKDFGKTPDFYARMIKIEIDGSQVVTGNVLIMMDATPQKTLLINDAKRCSQRQALVEIVDNILDNATKKFRIFEHSSGPLKIDIEYVQEADMIIITENSGGIPFDNMENLVKPGAPGRRQKEETIGVWGRGFKIALFALGNQAEVKTNYPHDPEDYLRSRSDEFKVVKDPWSRGVLFSRKWMTPVPKGHQDYREWSGWNIAQCEAVRVPKGETHIRIEGVSKGSSPDKQFEKEGIDPFYELLMQTYGQALHELRSQNKFVQISLTKGAARKAIDTSAPDWNAPDGRYICPPFVWTSDYLRKQCIFPPSFSPLVREFLYTTSVPDPETQDPYQAEVKMKVTVGLFKEGSAELAGFWLFGNGRYFAHSVDKPFFGAHKTDKMPKYHDTLRNMFVLVELVGDPNLIPWRGPLKDGFEKSPTFEDYQLRDLKKMVGPYAKFWQNMYGTGIETIFCEVWNVSTQSERYELLFPLDSDLKKFKGKPPFDAIVADTLPTDVKAYHSGMESEDPVRFSSEKASELGNILGKHRPDGTGDLDRVGFLRVLFEPHFIKSGQRGLPREKVVEVISGLVDDKKIENVLETHLKDSDAATADSIVKAFEIIDPTAELQVRQRYEKSKIEYFARSKGSLRPTVSRGIPKTGAATTIAIKIKIEEKDLTALSAITGVSEKDKAQVVTAALDQFLEEKAELEEDEDDVAENEVGGEEEEDTPNNDK